MIQRLIVLCVCILLGIQFCTGQVIKIDTSLNISMNDANDVSASWSSDSEKIIYQSDRNGNWDIFLYDIEADTTIQLTNSLQNEQRPKWHPLKDIIVFDAGEDSNQYLYKFDLVSKEIAPLFDRRIICKQPSLAKDGRMVYFLGYDGQHKNWELFSYHFIYDNLNQITNFKGDGTFLGLSPNGKSVFFGYHSPTYPFRKFKMFNWYGNEISELGNYNIQYATWHPYGLKIYFISDKDNMEGELYSIWKDGSHEMRLTDDHMKIRDVSISPDGNSMLCSVLLNGNYEIIIIQLESF